MGDRVDRSSGQYPLCAHEFISVDVLQAQAFLGEAAGRMSADGRDVRHSCAGGKAWWDDPLLLAAWAERGRLPELDRREPTPVFLLASSLPTSLTDGLNFSLTAMFIGLVLATYFASQSKRQELVTMIVAVTVIAAGQAWADANVMVLVATLLAASVGALATRLVGSRRHCRDEHGYRLIIAACAGVTVSARALPLIFLVRHRASGNSALLAQLCTRGDHDRDCCGRFARTLECQPRQWRNRRYRRRRCGRDWHTHAEPVRDRMRGRAVLSRTSFVADLSRITSLRPGASGAAMGLSTEQVQILDLLRQVERTARKLSLVVWLARIAIRS